MMAHAFHESCSKDFTLLALKCNRNALDIVDKENRCLPDKILGLRIVKKNSAS